MELELAGERLTLTRIAETLARVLRAPVTAPGMTVEEAVAAGMPPMGAAHERLNTVPQPADPAFARALGIPLTPFGTWAETHLREAAIR